MSDAFDADVLIYAASGHALGPSVLGALQQASNPIGSVLLLPEVLSKPIRLGNKTELAAIEGFLARLDLKPMDMEIATASTAFAAKYRLRAADAVHLATAIVWGAERFHTNNRKDFGPHIEEVEVVWPG